MLLDPYDRGFRRLIEVCHDVSTKPPLGQAPAWARERPLAGADLSPDAQRMAASLNEHSEVGVQYDYFERDALLTDLGLTPEQAAMVASELEDSAGSLLGQGFRHRLEGVRQARLSSPVQIRCDGQLEQIASQQPRGEEQNLEALHVAGLRVEPSDHVVAKLLALLFRVRRPAADVQDVSLAVVLER